jgi:predicted TIM-barrel fold metal-dependent hydrolase
VYFDTAFTLNYIDEQLFKKIIEKHGEDKILFATDAPWQDMKDNLQRLKSFNIEKSVLDKILYKNACKLLKIGE